MGFFDNIVGLYADETRQFYDFGLKVTDTNHRAHRNNHNDKLQYDNRHMELR